MHKTYIGDDEIELMLPNDHDLRAEIAICLRVKYCDKKFVRFSNAFDIFKIFLWVLAGALSLKVFQHAYTYHQLANAFEKLGYETNISHSLYVIMGTIVFLCAMSLLLKLGDDHLEKIHRRAYEQDNYFKDKDTRFCANQHFFKMIYNIPNGEYESKISWSIIQNIEVIEHKCIVLLLDTHTNFFYIPKDIFKDDLEFKQVFEQLSQWQQESRVSA